MDGDAPWIPKQKSRPQGGFLVRIRSLSLRVLLAAPRLVQADFLSLYLAGVARHQSGRAELAFQAGIVLDQGAGDSVAHRTRLPAFPAPVHVHQDVEAGGALREL